MFRQQSLSCVLENGDEDDDMRSHLINQAAVLLHFIVPYFVLNDNIVEENLSLNEISSKCLMYTDK